MLSYARASELFTYDNTTGNLHWKVATSNRVKVGSVVGNVMRSGVLFYRQCSADGHRLQVHRIVWLLHYGKWPENFIDHEDGDGLNNRVSNLRDATDGQNKQNASLRSDNASGHTGVTWHKKARKWVAQIQIAGTNYYLGLFSDLPAAVEARKRASRLCGFHKNHGRARL